MTSLLRLAGVNAAERWTASGKTTESGMLNAKSV